MQNMFSSEFLEGYKNGQREFSNINLQYADISGANLNDIIIKDSKLFFVTFRSCDFSNAKFINCEIFFGTFLGGSFTNAVFEKCIIDFTLFERINPKNTKILKSKVSWSGILYSIMSEIDVSSSDTFRFITDISQITQNYVDEAMLRIGPMIGKLDISIRAQIKEEIEREAREYKVKIMGTEGSKSNYGNHSKDGSHENMGSVYGTTLQNFTAAVISAYNDAHPYQAKRKYDTDSTYK